MTHISEENEKRETKERERTPVALLRDEPRRFHSVRSVGGTAAANCHQHQVTAQSRGLGRRWGAAGGPRGPSTAAPAPPARAAAAIPARAARGRLAGRGGVRGGGCATGRLRPGEDKRLGAPSGRQPPAAETAARSGRSALPFPHGHGRGGGGTQREAQPQRSDGGRAPVPKRDAIASAPLLTPGRSGRRRGRGCAGRGRGRSPPQEPRAATHSTAQRRAARHTATQRPPARPRSRQSARPPLGRSAHAPALPARRGQWAAGDAKRRL